MAEPVLCDGELLVRKHRLQLRIFPLLACASEDDELNVQSKAKTCPQTNLSHVGEPFLRPNMLTSYGKFYPYCIVLVLLEVVAQVDGGSRVD